jgi:gluconate 5-dehydrogenase
MGTAPKFHERRIGETDRQFVINIASDAVKLPTTGESIIAASTTGIVMFTRTLAIEGRRN